MVLYCRYIYIYIVSSWSFEYLRLCHGFPVWAPKGLEKWLRAATSMPVQSADQRSCGWMFLLCGAGNQNIPKIPNLFGKSYVILVYICFFDSNK